MSLTNPFDPRNIVGYIQEISVNDIKVHFPDSRKMQRFFHHSKSLHWWMIWGYAVIESESKWFLGKFTKISLPDKERNDLSEENYKNSEFHPIGYIEILFAFDLLTFEPEKSINNFPPISSKVYVVNSKFYTDLLNKTKPDSNQDLLSVWQDIETWESISLSANKIFQRHCAIVWTTGWWKSYTVSKIIEELIKKKWAKIILLDPTGEFSSLDILWEAVIFNSSDENSTFFNYKDLLFEDICALFRPSGQSQLPLLEHALKILTSLPKLKEKYPNDQSHFSSTEDGIEVFCKANKSKTDFNRIIGVSRIWDYKIKSLVTQLYFSAVYDSNRDDSRKFWWVNENTASYLQSLIFRIQTLLSDKDANAVFNFSDTAVGASIINVMESFFSEGNLGSLLRVDLSNVPEVWDLRSILVNSLWRYFLHKAKDRAFMQNPVIIFLDEAHLFLWKKVRDEYSIEVELNAFERIAKECRKYWLYLCISTQRPRDIPEGILSQMGTFIVHRLINDKDKQAIENAVSNYSKSFLNFLPSLGKWEALLMGVEFLTTIFLKIQETVYPPNSDTPPLFFKKSESKE